MKRTLFPKTFANTLCLGVQSAIEGEAGVDHWVPPEQDEDCVLVT